MGITAMFMLLQLCACKRNVCVLRNKVVCEVRKIETNLQKY